MRNWVNFSVVACLGLTLGGAGLAQDLDLSRAIERAVHAAALATTRQGAAQATPDARALDEFTAAPKLCMLTGKVA